MNLPIRGSEVVSVYPLNDSVGVYAKRLYSLGLHERIVMFKIINSYPDEGFHAVISNPLNFYGAFTFLSMHFKSRWSREVSERSLVHFTSPDYFHLAKYNGNCYGTVHDLFPLRGGDFSWPYRYFFRKEMEAADRLKGIVVVSDATREEVNELFPHLNVRRIHNWTGNEFAPRDKGWSRRELGLPHDRKIVLSIGSDAPRKNVQFLESVMGFLGNEYLLVRIGHLNHMKPANNVLGLGKVSEDRVPLYFNAADVLVAPSLREGFNLPLIEAINSNLPAVASDIPAHREVLRGQGNLMDTWDPRAWAEAIKRAIDDGPKWSGFGDYYRPGRARKEYMELYGIDSSG